MLLCGHCQSPKVIYFGKQNGVQRYKCNACSKTFSSTKRRLIKKDICKQSLHLILEGFKTEEIAQFLGVNKYTVENWKNKYLKSTGDLSQVPSKLKPLIDDAPFRIEISKPKRLGSGTDRKIKGRTDL